MTIRLFEDDSFLTEADAVVTDCRPLGQEYAVTLDRTVFFPEGGGQPGDQGAIGSVRVLDTYREDDRIIHRCDAPLTVGDTVHLTLDFERRLDHIQQHTGEHMLSYACWHLFGAVNVGFHMNDRFATIDLDRVLTAEQLTQAEDFANRLGYDDRPIRVTTENAADLDPARVRKISQKGGDTPRVVAIEGADVCTCCGTHARSTGQVLPIKIIHEEKNRGGVRLTFLCGGRALRDHREKTDVMHALSSLLSTEAGNFAPRVADLQRDLADARRQLREKTEALTALRAAGLLAERGESPYVLACLENASAAEAKAMLNHLIAQPVVAVVVYTAGESLSFLCAAHPDARAGADCATVCDLLCGVYNAKGGGKAAFAQGGGKASPDWKERAATVLTALRQRERHS